MKKWSIQNDINNDLYFLTRKVKNKYNEILVLRVCIAKKYPMNILNRTRYIRKQIIEQMDKKIKQDTFLKFLLRKLKKFIDKYIKLR